MKTLYNTNQLQIHRNENTKHNKNNIGAVRKIDVMYWDKNTKF